MAKLMFNYHKSANETFNTLVEAFNELVMDFRANKSETKEYKEANATFSESIGKYCAEQSNVVWEGVEMLKNPQLVTNNIMFSTTFSNVLAQAITPAVPAIISNEYTRLYDVQQVGWGNAAKYTVESNEFFIVYDLAEGIARQNQQTAYNTEYSISASKKTISVQVNWYQVACGILDWGKFGAKVAKSFEYYIQASVIKAMSNAVTNASTLGIGGYKKVGTDANTWIELKRLVAGANANSEVYALGSLGALAKVVPDDAGFRFNSNDDLVTVGYLPSYKQVPMVQIDDVINPNTVNGTPSLLTGDDYIYFIPMGFNKPVKVVIEGNNVVVSQDPLKTKDNTLGLTISMYIGVDTIVGTKFGVLDVSD